MNIRKCLRSPQAPSGACRSRRRKRKALNKKRKKKKVSSLKDGMLVVGGGEGDWGSPYCPHAYSAKRLDRCMAHDPHGIQQSSTKCRHCRGIPIPDIAQPHSCTSALMQVASLFFSTKCCLSPAHHVKYDRTYFNDHANAVHCGTRTNQKASSPQA